MRDRYGIYWKQLKERRYTDVATFAVLGVLIGSVAMYGLLHRTYQEDIVEDQVQTIESKTLEASNPVHLSIPKIDLEASFEAPLGLNSDQTAEVPYSFETVGWYKYGPAPGELGPAVVFGHVDSKEGPAVFYSLGQLDIGDSIFIEREDGTIAEFSVIDIGRYNQEVFPRAKVYGDLDYAGLRLITCTGTYDKGKQRYSHNLVVYAKLKDSNQE